MKLSARERLRDKIVSGIRDREMISKRSKLKLEELTFDIPLPNAKKNSLTHKKGGRLGEYAG